MSENDAIEAALNQYSLLLTGIPAADHNSTDQDGMREELNALLQLMRPHIAADTLEREALTWDPEEYIEGYRKLSVRDYLLEAAKLEREGKL